MDDNIVRLPPRPSASAALQSALMLAEMNRKMCLEAAASFVETLQGAVATAPAHRITGEAMAHLLAEVAKAIRELKNDGADSPTLGGAA